MRVTISSENVVSETTSKGNEIHKQRATVHAGPDYNLEVDVSVEKGRPYKAGEYELAPRSYKVGRFGGLELDPFNTKLLAVGVAAARPAPRVA